ncbi:Uncharacterised protein [Mycobacteroides abscessus subsp. abscessus]|nr:Uncharacterised protein [Mycobacteroides abscessus subsp. abscessus]
MIAVEADEVGAAPHSETRCAKGILDRDSIRHLDEDERRGGWCAHPDPRECESLQHEFSLGSDGASGVVAEALACGTDALRQRGERGRRQRPWSTPQAQPFDDLG